MGCVVNLVRTAAQIARVVFPDIGDAMSSPLTPDYARPERPADQPPMLDYSAHDLAWYQDQCVRLVRENAELAAENRRLRAAVEWHARADGMA